MRTAGCKRSGWKTYKDAQVMRLIAHSCSHLIWLNSSDESTTRLFVMLPFALFLQRAGVP